MHVVSKVQIAIVADPCLGHFVRVMAPKARRTQPTTVSAEQIGEILSQHAPHGARRRAKSSGMLFTFDPPKSNGLIDRDALHEFSAVLAAMLKLNTTGIFNASTISKGISLFDEDLGGAILDKSHPCMTSQQFEGEHLTKQGTIVTKHFQALRRLKSNTTVGSKHPSWLQHLLNLLDSSSVVSSPHGSSMDEMEPSPSPTTRDASEPAKVFDLSYMKDSKYILYHRLIYYL